MKKVMIALVALVITLAFGVYKTHKYQAQKAWEEKIAEATAEKSSVDDLMPYVNSDVKGRALAIKFKKMPDQKFGCIVDSFIRGYDGDPEDRLKDEFRHKPLTTKEEEFNLALYKFKSSLDVSIPTGNYGSDYGFSIPIPDFFKREEEAAEIVAREIVSRPSKAGRKEVIEGFYRSLDQHNPWQISRASELINNLINREQLSESEVYDFCKKFWNVTEESSGDEEEFLLRSGISETLAEKGYAIEKARLGSIHQATTEELLSFANEWNGSHLPGLGEIISELKTRALSNEQALELARFRAN